MTAAVRCAYVCAGLGRAVRLPDQHGAGLPGQHDAGLPDQSGSRMLPSRQFMELYRKLRFKDLEQCFFSSWSVHGRQGTYFG